MFHLLAASASDITSTATVTIAVCGMVSGIAGPFLLSWLTGKQRVQERMQDYARQDEVAERLIAAQKEALEAGKLNDRKLDKVIVTGAITHSLVNSAMGAQLKISAIALRRLANVEHNPDDIAAAELAEKALAEHEANARKVDAKAAEANMPREKE